jgi:antitoxin component HigA of HigAB toxin-antitoxin module
MLKHLLEQHGLSGVDLSRLLGVSSKLGPMILRGERSITVEHARALGAHFGLPAGAFIE